MSIYNCTPHDITIIDKATKEVIKTFPKNEKHVSRMHNIGDTFDSFNGIPIMGVNLYDTDEKEWNNLGLKAGDAIIVNTVGVGQIEQYALRDHIRVFILASSPGQCHRNEHGEITGVYFLLEHEEY